MLQTLLLVLLAEGVWLGPDAAPLPFGTSEEAVSFLRGATLVKVEKRFGGTTMAEKLLVQNDGIRAHAVFRSFQRVYYNAKWDTGRFTKFLRDSYRNEIAAYELSRLLGLDTVPPTVEWKLGRRQGVLQLWIEKGEPGFNPKEAHKRKPPDPEHWRRERAKMRAFDALIENVDRHVGNMLIDPTGRVWWIDHTRSFGREHNLQEPDLIQRCHRGLFERLKAADPTVIAERMAPYMSEREIEALLERRLKLIALIEQRIAEHGEPAVLFD
jgi:hypothetical protein